MKYQIKRKIGFVLVIAMLIVMIYPGETGVAADSSASFVINDSGELTQYVGVEKAVKIPAEVTRIGDTAFQGLDITSVEIPDSVTEIGEGAFAGCEYLTVVNIPASVTAVGERVFYGCTSLESVVWKSSVGIPDSAFADCVGLTNLQLSQEIPSIGNEAFKNCESLNSFAVPRDTKEIGATAFDGCKNMTAISVDSANAYFTSYDNVLYTINGVALHRCPQGAKSITIHDGTKVIKDNAFYGCNLGKVVLPEGVTTIEAGAFEGCEIQTLVLGVSVTKFEIQDNSFKVHSIEVPENSPIADELVETYGAIVVMGPKPEETDPTEDTEKPTEDTEKPTEDTEKPTDPTENPEKPGDTNTPGNTENPGNTETPGNTENPNDTEDTEKLDKTVDKNQTAGGSLSNPDEWNDFANRLENKGDSVEEKIASKEDKENSGGTNGGGNTGSGNGNTGNTGSGNNGNTGNTGNGNSGTTGNGNTGSTGTSGNSGNGNTGSTGTSGSGTTGNTNNSGTSGSGTTGNTNNSGTSGNSGNTKNSGSTGTSGSTGNTKTGGTTKGTGNTGNTESSQNADTGAGNVNTDSETAAAENGQNSDGAEAAANGSGTGIAGKGEGTAYVLGKSEEKGWSKIYSEMQSAGEGDTIVICMNGTTVVPAEILSLAKEKNLTLILDMGNEIRWRVAGANIMSEEVTDVDFGVTMGSGNVPQKLQADVADQSWSTQMHLAYDGIFGLTADLTVNIEAANAGRNATLFYYNEAEEKLEYVGHKFVGEKGEVTFSFAHASDYVIVVDGLASDKMAVTASNEAIKLNDSNAGSGAQSNKGNSGGTQSNIASGSNTQSSSTQNNVAQNDNGQGGSTQDQAAHSSDAQGSGTQLKDDTPKTGQGLNAKYILCLGVMLLGIYMILTSRKPETEKAY